MTWNIKLLLAALAIGSLILLYVSYLNNRIDDLKTANETLSGNLQANIAYIAKYEAQKALNDKKTADLLKQAQSIPHDPKCLAPDSLKRVLNSL